MACSFIHAPLVKIKEGRGSMSVCIRAFSRTTYATTETYYTCLETLPSKQQFGLLTLVFFMLRATNQALQRREKN